MQILILEEDASLRTTIAAALADEGCDVMAFGRLDPAKAAARQVPVDVLVLGEAVGGRLAHDVALLAEWRNPALGAILLSDRRSEDMDELFELIPSLQAVVGRRAAPAMMVQLALGAARPAATPMESVAEPRAFDDTEADPWGESPSDDLAPAWSRPAIAAVPFAPLRVVAPGAPEATGVLPVRPPGQGPVAVPGLNAGPVPDAGPQGPVKAERESQPPSAGASFADGPAALARVQAGLARWADRAPGEAPVTTVAPASAVLPGADPDALALLRQVAARVGGQGRIASGPLPSVPPEPPAAKPRHVAAEDVGGTVPAPVGLRPAPPGPSAWDRTAELERRRAQLARRDVRPVVLSDDKDRPASSGRGPVVGSSEPAAPAQAAPVPRRLHLA